MTLICLDPGHGGADHGAENEKIVESKFVQDVADNIFTAGYHPLYIANIHFELTKELYSVNCTFKERAEYAEGSDLVICLHANSNLNPSVRGAEAYVRLGDETSKKYVQLLSAQLPKEFRVQRTFTCSENDWTVRALNNLRRHKQPAFLYEIGYISNERDLSYMLNDELMAEFYLKFNLGLLAIHKEIRARKQQ